MFHAEAAAERVCIKQILPNVKAGYVHVANVPRWKKGTCPEKNLLATWKHIVRSLHFFNTSV